MDGRAERRTGGAGEAKKGGKHWYLCIDLKSFYASVECVARGLDPMKAKLVVADPERSDKTICLAVSPALKALGVRNRCRVFEIPPGIDYIMAEPRMQKYIDCAAEIYGIYLRYLSPDDIHVYSIDEAFLDVTPYLLLYHRTPAGMADFLMTRVYEELGIRSSCGVGTNLYVTKIALDILAKHAPHGIAVLDEVSYRRKLWDYRPLTDFWRIGRGTAARLANLGIFTQRGIAEADEDLLYRNFGVDAELLIDHAWGREPVTIADIHRYQPRSRCLSSGQVLMRDYSFQEGALVLREMADQLCLDLTEKGLQTQSVSLSVGYARKCGRRAAGGTVRLGRPTSASGRVTPALLGLYGKIVDHDALVRRFCVTASVQEEAQSGRQLSFFDAAAGSDARDRKIQEAVLAVRRRYGKNAMLKGADFEEAATARARNGQIGGHKKGREDD